MKMTLKQKKFVEAKLKGKNNTQAIKEANPSITNDNYAKVAGHRMITNANVKAELDKGIARIEAKTNITVKKIQSDLIDLQERAKTTRDGMLEARCIELIGKTIAAFAEKNINIDEQKTSIEENKLKEAKELAKIRLIG